MDEIIVICSSAFVIIIVVLYLFGVLDWLVFYFYKKKEKNIEREKSEEIKNILHEISNKMSIIYGYSELLLYYDLTDEVKEKIVKINKSCFEITTILKNFWG